MRNILFIFVAIQLVVLGTVLFQPKQEEVQEEVQSEEMKLGALAPLQVAQGGTGSSTLSGILVGNGVDIVKTLVVGTGLSFDGSTLTGSGSMTALPEGNIYVGNASSVATATSSVTVTPTGQLKFNAFSASPLIYADSDTNSGILFTAPDVMSLMTGGTSRLSVNALGYVGIGTTSPLYPLDVYGNTRIDGTLTANNTSLSNLTVSGTASGTTLTMSGKSFLLGNVAIGTTTDPLASLHIDSGVTSDVDALFAEGTINNYYQLNIKNRSNGTGASTDLVATQDTGSELSGFINMGINSSGYTAGIVGNANDSYIYGSSTGNMLVGSPSFQKDLIFFTGNTNAYTNERMRILSTGNVGIGTTSPYSKLSVNGQVVASNYVATTTATSTLTNLAITGVIYKGTVPLLASGGTLTSAYHCRWDGTGVDCDRVEDASGACGANAVCMGGHTHVGVNETYGAGWNGDADTPEKDDVYDWGHVFDWDDDGKVSMLDTTYGVIMSSDAGTTTASSTPYVSSIVASSTSATSSFAGGFGIGSSTPSVQFSVDGRSGSFWRIFNNAKLLIMNIVDATVTLLGTWDFSGATVKTHTYPAFTYASSTTFIATTTVALGTARNAQAFNSVQCFTDDSFTDVYITDGTNRMNWFKASTTAGTVVLSTNNTFTAGEKRYVEFGNATSTKSISCSFDITVNN